MARKENIRTVNKEDKKLRTKDLIFAGAPHTEIREKAREHGMRTVREDGLQAIYNGETTVDEVVRYT